MSIMPTPFRCVGIMAMSWIPPITLTFAEMKIFKDFQQNEKHEAKEKRYISYYMFCLFKHVDRMHTRK